MIKGQLYTALACLLACVGLLVAAALGVFERPLYAVAASVVCLVAALALSGGARR